MDLGFGVNYDADDDEPIDESQIVDQLTAQLSRNLLGPSTSLPVSSTEDQLLRCRLERYEDEEMRQLEEDRLQEIIRLCQSYNESQEGKRVRSLRVNEVDHLLELMKNPTTTTTKTINSNSLVSSRMETNSRNNHSVVGSSYPTTVSEMTNFTTNQSNKPVNISEINESDYYQVENDSGYNTNGVPIGVEDNGDSELNGNKLTALSIEKSLIRNEIDDMKLQQFSDAEDEELKEFQRIEKEIKLNELYKCLETIEKEIVTIKQYQLQEQQQQQQHSPSLLVSKSDQEFSFEDKHDQSENTLGGGGEGQSSSGSGSGSKEAPLASFESDESTSSSDEDISLGDKVKSTDFSRLSHYHSQQHLDKYHTYSTIYSPTSETNSEFLGSSSSQAYNNSRDINQRENIYKPNKLRGKSKNNGDEIDSMKERQQRPLTIYLPSTLNDLDLVDRIVNLGHDVETFSHLVQLTPTSCSGYLWKLCSGTENQWRKRYFLFNRQNKVFVYFKSFKGFVKGKKAKYGVYFNQIEDAYVDHNRTKLEKKSKPLGGSLRRRSNSTRHVFVIVTSERNFTLSSSIPEVMRIWIDVIFTGAEGYLSFEH
ncbi:pleckstrin homology-like domain family B member 2 [Panonychus citri]|uniref:pleckstrin homology-like domain family B member 2 n=1 Tax=Panonychus citri TaxID=50023 RepID=UPI0023081650|nr:pleckstrin homology-like domain family B member 2 [Panonychus citri]